VRKLAVHRVVTQHSHAWQRAVAGAALAIASAIAPCYGQHPAAIHHPPTTGPDPTATDAQSQRERARFDYVLHCSGCHFLHGEGVAAGGIPRVRDQIGYLLTLPEGRAYLMQVPGLLAAGMPDEGAARVMNWMIDYFAGPSRPEPFVPYTAEEARRYRLERPADIAATRTRLAEQLRAAGYPFQ
jgi:cytochrome c553